MSSDSKLVDAVPGGESTQYESIKTVTKPHSKETGQMSDPTGETTSNVGETTEAKKSKTERGEKTAENIRYGEALSEHGFGGETTTSTGGVNQGSGLGGTKAAEADDDAEQTRRQQGYGAGSGVGG